MSSAAHWFCANCGRSGRDRGRFCPVCGGTLTPVASPQKSRATRVSRAGAPARPSAPRPREQPTDTSDLMDREALNIRLGVEEDECWKDARQHHSLQPSKKAMLNALGGTIFCIVFTIGAGAASAAGITQAAAFAILSAIIAALSAIRYVREKRHYEVPRQEWLSEGAGITKRSQRIAEIKSRCK